MYTHYFEITKRPDQIQWTQLMLDVEKLFKNLPTCEELEQLGVENDDKIILRGPMGDKMPICNTQRISFNGDAASGYDCDSFTLLAKTMDGFCKTGRKPYDFVVCAVLIIAYNHLPNNMHITSGGDSDDWDPALNYVRQYILPGARLPANVEVSPLQEHKTFFDGLKNIETSIGDFYFS